MMKKKKKNEPLTVIHAIEHYDNVGDADDKTDQLTKSSISVSEKTASSPVRRVEKRSSDTLISSFHSTSNKRARLRPRKWTFGYRQAVFSVFLLLLSGFNPSCQFYLFLVNSFTDIMYDRKSNRFIRQVDDVFIWVWKMVKPEYKSEGVNIFHTSGSII